MVSIIIPTYNKAPRLKLTLGTILQLRVQEPIELIIINDGSTDKTDSVVNEFQESLPNNSFMKVRYICTANKGRASARNIGIQKALGKWIILIDDDMLLDPNFITEHLLAQKQNENCVSRGRVYSLPFIRFFYDPQTGELYDGGLAKETLLKRRLFSNDFGDKAMLQYLAKNRRINSFEKDIDQIYKNTDLSKSNIRWLGFVGANVCLRRDVFFTVGEFDSNFGLKWGCEDLEFGYRLYQKKVRFVYAEAAVNYHMNHYRSTSKQEHRENMTYFYRKYGDPCLLELYRYFEDEITINDWIHSCLQQSKPAIKVNP